MHPDLKDKAILITDPSELAARRVPEAIAAVYQPYAAKLWPYKLVSWLLEQLLNTHDASEFNLQTNTPVTHFQHSGSSIIVPTPRGEIVAKEVLLATNAYTSHLLPNMASLIVPVRAQVCALEPPQGAIQLPHSYVWMKGADHQYVIQRGSEKTSEEFIFGGERLEEGVSRDDEVDPMLSQALRWSLTQAINLRPGDDPEIEELELTHEWTGIMGYSGDSNPWVGRVPRTLIIGLDAEDDSAGLWMSAGYEGHGMPVAPRCGIAIAHMILQSDDRVKVPEQWLISEERVAKVKAKDSKLLRSHQDMTKMLPVVS
jgi:glycine/D-amino acid oxidase-like deaminating enzyme